MLYAPYHAVIRRIVSDAVATVATGDTKSIAAKFHPEAVLCFSGSHALGGEIRGRANVAAWFERLRRIFPTLALRPLDIVVNGGPWATTVATRFSVAATLPDGTPYANEGMQYLRIRWGSIVEDRLYEDTAMLEKALQRIAASGNTEALAPQI